MFILSAIVIFSLLLVALGSWNGWQISRDFKYGITQDFELQRLSGQIVYLDEVLTMSSRMAAATGDLRWETRYNSLEPDLGEAITQAIALAPQAYEQHAEQTDAANGKLVAMETAAFELVRQGQAPEALDLLFSERYETQKQIYAEGMRHTTKAIETEIQNHIAAYRISLSRSSLFSLVSFCVLAIAWLMVLLLTNAYVRRRQQAEIHLRTAKSELEVSHAQLAVSEMALRSQTSKLEDTLRKLQETQATMIQNEKMSSLGHLVAGIAHEINNPVNFISGNLKYLQSYFYDLLTNVNLYQKYYPSPPLDIAEYEEEIELDFIQEDLPKIISSINLGTKRIQQIVLSLRNFSRMDESDCKVVDIHEGLDSTLLILQHRLVAKSDYPQIELIKNYGELPLVECYGGLLNQVFMNILSNAVDALRDNHRQSLAQNKPLEASHINISTSVTDEQWIEIVIRDNGCGMPSDVQEKIFNPFFTTKPVGKGTGMGMSICYQIIVEKHGGTLDCVSELGQGTELVIRIPMHQQAKS